MGLALFFAFSLQIVGLQYTTPSKNAFLTSLNVVMVPFIAFQIFFTGEFVKKYRVTVLNFVQMATAFILSFISLFVFGQTDFHVTMEGGLSVLYLGVVSTTVCYLLQTACQQYVDETKAAIILSMESVFGTIFSILLLHEVVTLRMVIGCVTILGAVMLANLSEGEECEGRQVTDNLG